MNTCKNCGTQFKGNFCNQCGQAARTEKMNWHFLWHDIQHGLLHFDKGLFYTLKQLFTRPGHSIREFLEGKRINHFKPLSLVIVLATICGLLSTYLKVAVIDFQIGDDPDVAELMGIANNWMSTHYVAYTLITLPLLAFAAYLIFRKQGYNLIECFVLNTFVTGQMLAIQLLFFPLSYIYAGTSTSNLIISLIGLISYIVMAWSYIQFFNRMPKVKVIFYTFLSYALMALIAGVLSVVVTSIYLDQIKI